MPGADHRQQGDYPLDGLEEMPPSLTFPARPSRTMLEGVRTLVRLAWVKGWRRTVSAGAGSLFGYQRWYVLWTPLEPLAPAPAAGRGEFTCRLASLADLDGFAVFAPQRSRREFRHWLESGNHLFLVLDGPMPVGYHCMSSVPPVIPPLSRIQLTEGQLWFEEMYVLPQYRRRHASAQLRRYRQRCLREWGYEEVVSGVRERNVAALNLIYAYNPGRLRRVERHTCLTVLGLSRVRVEAEALPNLEAHLRRVGLLGTGPSPARPPR